MKSKRLFCALLALTIGVANASGQSRVPCPVAEPGLLVVYGDIVSPYRLTIDEIRALPQVSVQETPHGGTAANYSGPKLEDVLAKADLPRGPALRGAEMLRYIVVEAVDGYRALFALAEIDSAFRKNPPILAIARDGGPLDEDAAPFQVIVPGEERHARWVRQVACIRIARHR